MCDEQTDSYLIHSDVFESSDENSQTTTDLIEFLVQTEKTEELDDDGDWILDRPERIRFILEHRNRTSINECGFQLWNGALLLCDFIFHNSSKFSERIVLELGAGIGLCSLVASRYASRVISTDRDENLLNAIRKNIEINIESCRSDLIQVQRLDWNDNLTTTIDDSVEIIIAADVIYDDDLTDLFFNVITKVINGQSKFKSLYIAVEKRFNFYLETRSVQCPAYDYFVDKLEILKLNMAHLCIEQIPVDHQSIPQSTKIYERTEQLVLWHIGHLESLKRTVHNDQ